MRLLKNKYFIAILCLLISFFIVLQVSKYAESSKDVTTIIKLTTQVEPNVEIKENMVREVEVGKYNLPKGLITDRKDIVGKYSAETIYPDDILLPLKFKDKADVPDLFLCELQGDRDDRVAVSVSVKTLAAGLSGKLVPGDIVSILVYKKGELQNDGISDGKVLEYPDLKYVEVGAISNNKAEDLGVKKKDDKTDTTSTDTIIPATITLLVNEQQAKTLVIAENTGVIHLVFRGRGEAARSLLEKNVQQSSSDSKTNLDMLNESDADNDSQVNTQDQDIYDNSVIEDNQMPDQTQPSDDGINIG